ncbi:hypothetical protein SKAU_G00417080 [Synaphobranchus kaupii]|uniref:TNFR-Cys domain-containing protein n=1 Tax=Synaphobranchus kaupii TaxID=118154 RepID=A0A9Q1E5Y6_SYNKA|nr:hypothetical protein SKAU_G00417080 [Synaphobranchus kaupii]
MRAETICLMMSLLCRLGTEDTTIRYSIKCRKNLETYWNKQLQKCEACKERFVTHAGCQFAPNCGRQDNGGQPTPMHVPCGNGTFNDGSFVTCRKCMSCPPDQPTLALCNTTRDTQCCEKEMVIEGECQRPETTVHSTYFNTLTPTEVTQRESTSRPVNRLTTSEPSVPHLHYAWSATALLLFPVCLLLLILLKYKKVKCGRKGNASEVKRDVASQVNHKDKKVEELLARHIQEAPLRIVLDNLDVLEELIMLLDPDNPGAKTTRHVATHCSFSATWINYAYSMKESKSPLKAVLETVTTKFPDWTVGHLARVFNDIGRNDAVVILAKLHVLKANPCQFA